MMTGILILACWVTLGLYWNISARLVKSAAAKQDSADRLARMPVWLGFMLLLAAWIWPAGPVMVKRSGLSGAVGLTICASGLALAIWSRKVLGAEWS